MSVKLILIWSMCSTFIILIIAGIISRIVNKIDQPDIIDLDQIDLKGIEVIFAKDDDVLFDINGMEMAPDIRYSYAEKPALIQHFNNSIIYVQIIEVSGRISESTLSSVMLHVLDQIRQEHYTIGQDLTIKVVAATTAGKILAKHEMTNSVKLEAEYYLE